MDRGYYIYRYNDWINRKFYLFVTVLPRGRAYTKLIYNNNRILNGIERFYHN